MFLWIDWKGNMDKVKDIWNNLFIWKLTKTGKIVAAVLVVIVIMILWGYL